MSHHLLLDSRAEEVERLLDWVDPILAGSKLDDMAAFHFRCALVEIVNNCIRHAYAFEAGHPVEVMLDLEKDQVTATIRDRGPAFEPPDQARPSDPTAESGRGYEIIRSWVHSLSFARADGWNICQMTRRSR